MRYAVCGLLLLWIAQCCLCEGDPSDMELEMFDWTTGLRVAFCADAPVPDVMSPFRRAVAKIATKYCSNITACNLKRQVVFLPEQVVFLDGFPKREYGELLLKFFIVLPHASIFDVKQQKPLLPRAVLSDMLHKFRAELSSRLGWTIISYEKYPRFDPMTEFMNIAIIPIIIFSIPLMIFLAYWTSTLRPNMGSESWLVTGSSGGKNAALRRTMEIIAEQNEEIKRQEVQQRFHNLEITGAHDGLTGPAQLLLNVARLSLASSQVQGPPIVIYPSPPSTGSLSTIHTGPPQQTSSNVLQMRDSHPHFMKTAGKDRRNSRRQSSVEEIKEKRRRRGSRGFSGASSSSAPGAHRWKTGSLVFGGFRK